MLSLQFCLILLLTSGQILPDDPKINIGYSGRQRAVKYVDGGGTSYGSESFYDYGWSFGDNSSSKYYSGYQFNFNVPTDAYNISVKIVHNNFPAANAGVLYLIDDNTTFSNYSELYDEIEDGIELCVFESYSAQTHDITDDVINKLSNGFLKFGFFAETSSDGPAYVGMNLVIYYDAPIHIKAQNNFIYGKINVGVASSAGEKNSPYNFTANENQTVYLTPKDQYYSGYTRIWNDTEAPKNKSEWLWKKGQTTTPLSEVSNYNFDHTNV